METIATQLAAAGLVARNEQDLIATERGSLLFDRLVKAHRALLQRLAARWSLEQHLEAKSMLDRLARNLIAELPIAPAAAESLRAPSSR